MTEIRVHFNYQWQGVTKSNFSTLITAYGTGADGRETCCGSGLKQTDLVKRHDSLLTSPAENVCIDPYI